MCYPSPEFLRFCLSWSCAGLVHSITIIMSLYVHSCCMYYKPCFLSHLLPLSLFPLTTTHSSEENSDNWREGCNTALSFLSSPKSIICILTSCVYCHVLQKEASPIGPGFSWIFTLCVAYCRILYQVYLEFENFMLKGDIWIKSRENSPIWGFQSTWPCHLCSHGICSQNSQHFHLPYKIHSL